MNPLQRKLVIVLAGFGDNGATALELERAAHICQMKIYDEIATLAGMGMIVVYRKPRSGSSQLAAKLTDTAKGLLPRIKEISD